VHFHKKVLAQLLQQACPTSTLVEARVWILPNSAAKPLDFLIFRLRFHASAEQKRVPSEPAFHLPYAAA
jgi:hypothetical protein